jgi:hypothetical protein
MEYPIAKAAMKNAAKPAASACESEYSVRFQEQQGEMRSHLMTASLMAFKEDTL